MILYHIKQQQSATNKLDKHHGGDWKWRLVPTSGDTWH